MQVEILTTVAAVDVVVEIRVDSYSKSFIIQAQTNKQKLKNG